jgi:Na+-translocating ferredoxin:NAD+ oxidoreductase RnfD subunit
LPRFMGAQAGRGRFRLAVLAVAVEGVAATAVVVIAKPLDPWSDFLTGGTFKPAGFVFLVADSDSSQIGNRGDLTKRCFTALSRWICNAFGG